jgi:haloacetate dehalogenase
LFEGFTLERVGVGDATLRVRYGGSGPAILLLHGHPRTHTTWHRVAPLLAGSFTVVCPDLRGYGQSSHPPELPGHVTYSKRVMAADGAELMRPGSATNGSPSSVTTAAPTSPRVSRSTTPSASPTP